MISERVASILTMALITAFLFGGVYVDAGGLLMFLFWIIAAAILLVRPFDWLIKD